MNKVYKAIENGNGHTILSTGITGDDARLAKAVVDTGVTMLEPNHPALALARGYKGVTSMHDAEQIRHTFGLPARTPEEVAKVAGQIPTVLKERLCALAESVNVPTLAEGGINLTNYKAFKETGGLPWEVN